MPRDFQPVFTLKYPLFCAIIRANRIKHLRLRFGDENARPNHRLRRGGVESIQAAELFGAQVQIPKEDSNARS